MTGEAKYLLRICRLIDVYLFLNRIQKMFIFFMQGTLYSNYTLYEEIDFYSDKPIIICTYILFVNHHKILIFYNWKMKLEKYF